jgi:hypothetical protein
VTLFAAARARDPAAADPAGAVRARGRRGPRGQLVEEGARQERRRDLHVGGGLKYYVTPKVVLRIDGRDIIGPAWTKGMPGGPTGRPHAEFTFGASASCSVASRPRCSRRADLWPFWRGGGAGRGRPGLRCGCPGISAGARAARDAAERWIQSDQGWGSPGVEEAGCREIDGGLLWITCVSGRRWSDRMVIALHENRWWAGQLSVDCRVAKQVSSTGGSPPYRACLPRPHLESDAPSPLTGQVLGER